MEFLDRIIKPKFSPEEEREFQKAFGENNLASARLVQFQIFLIFIAAGYLDFVLLGELATLMIFMRYILFAPILLALVAFTFTSYFKKYMQVTFCIAVAITSCYVTLFTLLNEDAIAMTYFAGSIILIFVGFVYVPMLFKYAAAMSVFIFAMCVTGLYFNESFSTAIIEAGILLLLGTLSLALSACYTNERNARLNYSYEKLLSRQNETLEESNVYLKELATIDALTGISNRGAFDARFLEEWKRAERAGTSLSILLIDVDFFKLYNDTYGHQKGDDCLVEIAAALKSMVRRAGDFVARYGGEEFVFIVSNTDHDKTLEYANNIREKVESLNVNHRSSKVASVVTLSIGVASTIPGDEKDFDCAQLLRLADRALYQAKTDGRNRVSDSTALS